MRVSIPLALAVLLSCAAAYAASPRCVAGTSYFHSSVRGPAHRSVDVVLDPIAVPG